MSRSSLMTSPRRGLTLLLALGVPALALACTSGVTPLCDDAGSCLIAPPLDGSVVGEEAPADGSVDGLIEGGGADGPVEGGADGPVDSPVEGGADSPVEGSVDALVEGAVDGGVDGPIDGSAGAEPEPEAGQDADKG